MRDPGSQWQWSVLKAMGAEGAGDKSASSTWEDWAVAISLFSWGFPGTQKEASGYLLVPGTSSTKNGL